MKTDVRPEPAVEEDEPDRFFHGRRVVRIVTILTLGILAVLAIWQDPLYAVLH